MTERLRTYWRGLVIAAAVSLRQIGTLPGDDPLRESHPYVLVQDQPETDRFAPAERIGHMILTEPLQASREYSAN